MSVKKEEEQEEEKEALFLDFLLIQALPLLRPFFLLHILDT